MKIAIQAADLDASRIDGTRVYILNLLRRFGSIAPRDAFYIFHKSEFNPELTRPNLLGDMAIKNASKLIAISESTKRDILKFYPAVKEEKIKVIYHGFDAEL